MLALDAGAEDVTEEDDGTEITTAPTDLAKVRQTLVDAGMNITSAELKYVAANKIELDGEELEKAESLLDAIDDLDDVTAVHTNLA